MTARPLDPLLRTAGLDKLFLGSHALKAVNFELNAGEVHALMGENGAGKSTLIKLLTGIHRPDAGRIELDGQEVSFGSALEAVKAGISTVYQEVNLVPNLSVGENVCLGREPRGPLGIRWRALHKKARAALDRVGLSVDSRVPLRTCSLAIQQMVAIARALDVSAKVLILDEPTSSLDRQEVDQLFALMRRLREEGLGIIFVTHLLDQVYEISDRITVLRNGQRIGTWPTPDLPRVDLVTQMLGREAAPSLPDSLSPSFPSSLAPSAPLSPSLPSSLIDAKAVGKRGSVRNVNLALRSGETFGLAGLLGSGRTEVVRILFGVDKPDQGSISIEGRPIRRFTPRAMIRAGLGLCGEDRKREGLLPGLTVRENFILAVQAKRGWLKPLGAARQKQLAEDYIQRLGIRPPEAERQIQFLSGGNQQKVLLARWLAEEPKVLLLDEPTRGIDVGAKFEIMSLIDRLRSEGMGFVFVSSELAEVVRVCTKVLVMRDRRAVELLEGSEITEPRVVHAIAGTAA